MKLKSKMPSYKLDYFNMKGRAELARLILAYAGIEFEDVRYERDEWLQHKPSNTQISIKSSS